MRSAVVAMLGAALACVGTAQARIDGPGAGLVLSVQPPPAEVPLHGELTSMVTVRNDSADKISRVLISVALSAARTEFRSAIPSPQGTCEIRESKARVVCRLGAIKPGATVTVSFAAVASLGGDLVTTVALGAGDGGLDAPLEILEVRTRISESTAPAGVAIAGFELTRPFQTDQRLTVEWTGTDTDSGIAGFDVRVREARFGRPFGPPRTWLAATTEKKADFRGVPGSTHCFSVRATDQLGNVSAWSSDRCTAVPVGVTRLKRSAGWQVVRRDGYYGSHYALTKTRGATLSLAGIAAKRISLVVTKCPTCGAVEVLFNGRRLRTVQLRSAYSSKRELAHVATFASVRRGTLLLRVATEKARVKVEGIGVSAA